MSRKAYSIKCPRCKKPVAATVLVKTKPPYILWRCVCGREGKDYNIKPRREK